MNSPWWKRLTRSGKGSARGHALPATRRPARWYRPAFELLEARIAPATVTWINPAGGDWDTPANWSTGAVPGAGDDVVINALNAGAGVTHSQRTTDTVNSITAAAPISISGFGTLSVTGSFSDSSAISLANGTLANATIAAGTSITVTSNSTLSGVTLAGELVIDGGATVTAQQGLLLDNGTVQLEGFLTFVGGTFTNFATLLVSGSGPQALDGTGRVVFAGSGGQVNQFLSGAGPLTVAAGVSVSDTTAGGFVGGAGQALTVDGTVTASAGQGITVAGSSVTNNGPPGASSPSLQANGGALEVTNLQANAGGIAATDNGTLTLDGAWQNTGAISATASTVNLGGSFAEAGIGDFTPAASTVNLTGALDNTGATLALDSATGPWNLAGGTITGGTITTAGSDTLTAMRNSTLVGVTLAGELTIDGGATVTARQGLLLDNATVQLQGSLGFGTGFSFPIFATLTLDGAGAQTLGGTGQVVFAGSGGQVNQLLSGAGPLTVAAGVSVSDTTAGGFVGSSGQALTVDGTVTASAGQGITVAGSSVTNNGPPGGTTASLQADGAALEVTNLQGNAGGIAASNGATLTLDGAWQNTGAVSETVATIDLRGTFKTSGLGTLSGSGGAIEFIGTLTNDGTLTLNGGTVNPLYFLDGGTINGGTISTPNGTELETTQAGGTLNGVTLAGTLLTGEFINNFVDVTGGLTLAPAGLVMMEGNSELDFLGSQSLSGGGAVDFADNLVLANGFNPSGLKGLYVPDSGDVLTIGPGVTVHGDTGFVGSTAGGAVTNDGTIAADGGGAITVQKATNYAAGTLTAGTWEVADKGTLILSTPDLIATNAADIVLDGAGSHFDNAPGTDILSGLAGNAAGGGLTVQNGYHFVTSQAFSNAGRVTVAAGSTFSTGNYTQTGGSTEIDGQLSGNVTLNGGTLSGSGSVLGNVVNAAQVAPGSSSPSVLTINGNYTQTAAGTLALKVGGATAGSQFDQVNVSGTATFDGTLNVTLLNGFAPDLEQTFDVLNFGASAGSFAVFNSPRINGAPAFVTSFTPARLDLVGATSAADLAVGDISLTPTTGTTGQDLTVNYTVNNPGTVTATGSWTDSVYLSTDTTLSADDILLGRVTHSGDVAGLSGYSGALTAPLPGVIDGTYHVIIVADSRLQVPDVNRANNTRTAPTPLIVRAPLLTLGVPVSGVIADGQDLFYRLNVPPGGSVQVSASLAASLEADLLVRFGAMPTPSAFDLSGGDPTSQHPLVLLPSGQGGAYYVLLHGLGGAGAGQSFTLRADVTPFEVTSIDPATGGNQGQSTVHVTGAGFSPNTTVSLRNGGTVRNATSVTFFDANHLTATFDLTGLPAADYALEADDGARSATAPTPFHVTATPAVPAISTRFSVPARVRTGSPMSAAVTVTNFGANDVLLPDFQFTASDARPPVVNDDPGVLPAGRTATGQFSFVRFGATFLPSPSANHLVHDFKLTTLPPTATIDWADAQGPSRPPSIPADAWAVIWANYMAAVGTTVADLQATLQADETYFAQLGTPTTDTATLLSFEVMKANAVGPVPSVGDAVDVSVPEPGLSLTFSRTFVQSIAGRYRLGSLGRGWVSNWDMSATTDPSNGAVFIQVGTTSDMFVPQKDGTYQGAGSGQGTLTNSGGHFTLRELDGSVTSFLPDGRLDSVQDANGDRITAGYTDGLLTSLTHSDGDQLHLTYDARGRLRAVTDPFGRTVTYAYDAADEHLTGVASAQGTYAYTYVTGQGAAEEHALASATYSDGSHLGLTYDARGRLTGMDDGSSPTTFAYLSPGGYTITDGNGATSTVLVDSAGQPAAITDALGHVRRVSYNGDGLPVLAVAPDGAATATSYDSRGNPSGTVDPLGDTSLATYNPQFNGLQTFQDPLGATTSLGYDGQGNLRSITYADGTATQFTPGPGGLVSQSVNARGQASHFAYNSRGQVIEADYADGTTTYTYDAHGNLHTATDAGGTTTLTYDGADRLTRVDYPNGLFLQIGYDAFGRRSQTVDQTGFTTNFQYDSAGRLTTVTDGSGALIASYAYDATGRVAEKDLGNGTYTTYTYDPAGNVQSVVNHGPRPAPAVDGPVNSRFDYTYDSNGRVLTETTLSGTTTYGYDAAGQLTSASLPGGRVLIYAYDADGNRTVVDDSGATTTYAANSLDQYTAAGPTAFGYDADGNLTARGGPGGTTTYTYDSRGRLTGVTTPTDTWAYGYDALGNRTSATHNGQTTQYLVDPAGMGNVVGEYTGSGALVAHYTQGLGLTSRIDATGSASYYDFDALGSTAGLTGAAGGYVDTYSYLPFGQLSSSTGSVANPFQYVGRDGVMSDGSGLDFMRARFYSPTDGRFVTRDPLGLAGGTNIYRYAGNAPVNFIDPSGMQDWTPSWDPWRGHPYRGIRIPEPEVFGPGGTSGTGGAPTEPVVEVYGPSGAAGAGGAARGVGGAAGAAGAGGAGGGLSALQAAGLVGLVVVDVVLWNYVKNDYHQLQKELFKYVDENMPIVTAADLNVVEQAPCEEVGPDDPNFISGPAGSGPQNFVAAASPFPYAVYFENQPTASAPALVVTVTQQLDPNLDWSTFQFGTIGFGTFTIDVPPGLQHYSTRVDATASLGCFVDVTADLDRLTGLVSCTFTTIDPATLDVPAGDPQAGFLPPDDASQRGEGWVSYAVSPRAGLPTGTVVNAKGTVTFDAGLPDQSSLDTAPIFNTIDAGPPTSSVRPLPALSPASFPVSWSGSDDAGGSGIATFDVFVSDNGGPFVPFLSGTTQTSATFAGVPGHTYGFYSVATDNVGNVQATPAAAQARTTVATASSPTDITSQVSIVKGGYRRLSGGLWVQQVTITNTSGTAIAGPVTLSLKSLKGGTLASATVNGAAAAVQSAQDGSPYVTLVGQGGVFTVNQQLTVVLDFSDPNNLALSWVAQLLAGPGPR